MAEIRRLLGLCHLRAEATSQVLYHRRGKLVRAGRGLAFWFNPMSAAIAEVPVDDRDLNYLFLGRTADYQEVIVQGVITYRVVDAQRLADRLDFSIDLERGVHVKQPLEQIVVLLTGIAQQAGVQVIASSDVADLMVRGFGKLAVALDTALRGNPTLVALGLAVENVRIDEVKPTAELERALQTPTREALQQRADEATFLRRAMAVEKERAIAENELQTQVELARRQESLITQEGQNARKRVEHESDNRRLGVVALSEDQRIEAAALAERRRLEALTHAETEKLIGGAAAERARLEGQAEAETVRALGEAKAAGEHKRLEAYRDLPPHAVLALAAQELAGQLKIDSLTITPDMLGNILERAARVGLAKLEGGAP